MAVDVDWNSEVMMANFRSLPDEALNRITEQVGVGLAQLNPVPALGAASNIQLFETVDVWMLSADALLQQTDDLTQLAKPTGRWHHQIKVDDQPTSYARSIALGPDASDWSVVGVFESSTALKIDEAIAWIDNNISDDYMVHLLTVPAYSIESFWLIKDGDQKIVVISAPDEYAVLKTQQAYTSGEFLNELRSLPNIQGLVLQ